MKSAKFRFHRCESRLVAIFRLIPPLHERARSYACEGVGPVRETGFARRLTPAATVQGPDARSKGLEATHYCHDFNSRRELRNQ